MKKSILFILLVLSFKGVLAQLTPNFNYQTIVRDQSGQPLTNQTVKFKIFLEDNYDPYYHQYEETHLVTTNQFGLATLIIGQGTNTQGSFYQFAWIYGLTNLTVYLDINGGNNYSLIYSGLLNQVPFAVNSIYSDSLRIDPINSGYIMMAKPTNLGSFSAPLVKSSIYQHPVTNNIIIGASSGYTSNNDNFPIKLDGSNTGGNSLLLQSNTNNTYLRFKGMSSYSSDGNFTGHLVSKVQGIEPNIELTTDALNNNGNVIISTKENPIAYFTPLGTVSIGTSWPSAKLAVKGKGDFLNATLSLINKDAANPDVHLAFANEDLGNSFRIIGLFPNTYADEALVFHNAQIGEMGRFGYYGNFGVGTQNPKARLHIKSASQASPTIIPNAMLEEENPGESTKLMFRNGSSTINNWCISALPGSSGTNSIMNFFNDHGNNVLTLKGDGAIQFNGTLQPGANPGNLGDVLVSGGSGAPPYWESAGTLGGSWTTVGNDIHNANSGNIGIGTSAPAANLDINGSMRLKVRHTSAQPISAGPANLTVNDDDNVIAIDNSFGENFSIWGILSNVYEGRVISIINRTSKVMTLVNGVSNGSAGLFQLPSSTNLSIPEYGTVTMIAVDYSGPIYWQVLD